MELLAPAGNVENFHAALDAGADAVYLGAPGINARNLSRDLLVEEIAAMLDFAHARGKKVYLAANSLILERDLDSLVESLSLFERLQPDALIVQDLALVSLIRHHFPSLAIHSSTLMGAHNSDIVDLFANMGCSRVVTARELTLKELADLQKKAQVELEVFVHGAMCYSFSGLCLFSSSLGGKSGLRGRCVQPCRRGYTWKSVGRGRGDSRGRRGGGGGGRSITGGGSYIFSMNDLSGFDAVPVLENMGIASLKIEGRLRSANYVSKIVEAYRTVLDSREEQLGTAIKKAQGLAEEALARKTSSGYFFTPQPLDAIVAHHSGNMGLHLGSFQSVRAKNEHFYGTIKLKRQLGQGDRLRIHIEKSGERKSLTLHNMVIHGVETSFAEAGETVTIELPSDPQLIQQGRVELYKVDVAGMRGQNPLNQLVKEKKETVARIRKRQAQKVRILQKELKPSAFPREVHQPTTGKKGRRGPSRKSRIEIWLRVDSPGIVFSRLPFTPDMLILNAEKNLISQSAKIKKHFGKNFRNIIWALPAVVLERDLGRLRKQVLLLLRSGFKSFQLAHIGQMTLFGRERVHLYGDFSLNIGNSEALRSLAAERFAGCQAAIELDRQGYSALATGFKNAQSTTGPHPSGKAMKIGLTVYATPPLFTSRLGPDHFQYRKQAISPKGEGYRMVKQGGMVLTVPDKPFSLLPHMQEIVDMGYDFGVIDLTRIHAGEKEIREVADRLQGKPRMRKLPTFNYLGKLE